ncbi:unnamed protein product [Hydatigera taeniaeformis]|uniref:Fibronectin type-III domain-containing protein n=1 Tax=Hydatigena taeniaeformis TaxID=6205 RepID=A0A3P7EX56_HYDTA|nr:unnamed protein product [Hydatigera taeniaeformis]
MAKIVLFLVAVWITVVKILSVVRDVSQVLAVQATLAFPPVKPDCEHKCSCTPENRCSHINGNCIPPNHCTLDRTGPGCQIVRSKLTTSPTLEFTCTSLTISWSVFNKSIDSGIPDVRKYRLELRSDTSTNFTEVRTVSREQIAGAVHSVVYSDVKPGERYWARVVPIFYLDMGGGDGYLEEGIASPPSREAFIPKGERPTGPRNCALVGLAGRWVVFRWDHGLNFCGLGELMGYELQLTSFGGEGDGATEGEMVVKSYRTDTLTTAIVAADLTPATKYRAKWTTR